MEQKSEFPVQRKRGRPAGKNRVALSQEERRARNAHYERERREEYAQAVAMLAESAGCDPNVSMMVLLDNVTSFLKKEVLRDSSDDISNLRNLNENLIRQIVTLEERLQCVDVHASVQAPTKYHEEVPVRTHTNHVLRKRVKFESPKRPCSAMCPTPSPFPFPEQLAVTNTSSSLTSVLDDVISLEEEKKPKRVVPDCSQWSPSHGLDDVISLEEELRDTRQAEISFNSDSQYNRHRHLVNKKAQGFFKEKFLLIPVPALDR